MHIRTRSMRFLRCSDTSIFKKLPGLDTNICSVQQLQLTSTSIACGILILISVFCYFHFRKRCYSTLLCFHNLRSAITVTLFIINSLELARGCLPVSRRFFAQFDDSIENENMLTPVPGWHNTSILLANKYDHADITLDNTSHRSKIFPLILLPGSQIIWSSGLAILFAICLIAFHRIVEVKNVTEFLYISSSILIYSSFVRFYNLAEISFGYNNFLELEPFIQSSSGILLLSLGLTDGYTIYKERFKPRGSRKSDDAEKKIGYRHSYSTFYSKAIFWWLTPLLRQGYKTPLELEDLGNMREEDSARSFYDQFLIIYKATSLLNKQPSLWRCYIKSSWMMFTFGGLLKLLGDLSALVGPISIQMIVLYIEKNYKNETSALNTRSVLYLTQNDFPHEWSETIKSAENVKIYHPSWIDLFSNGWVIAWIVLLSSLSQGALSQASTHILNITGIRIKTSLQGLIYRKTLLLSSSCLASTLFATENSVDYNKDQSEKHNKQGHINTDNDKTWADKATTGTSGANEVGAITNLMSEDALNVMSFFWIAHYVWAIPLKIGVVMYLLYKRLGPSAIIGSCVCILTMTPLQFLIGKAMSNNSEKLAKSTDERLRKTHDIFWGIKLIKLHAWENVFAEKIRSARNQELKFLNKESFYWTLMTFLTHVSSVLITFVTLAVYTLLETGSSSNYENVENVSPLYTRNTKLTASSLFSALSLFNQLTVPLLIFPITVPIIISAIVSTRRLERFLREREVQKEFEGIRHMARIFSKSDASLDMYEDEETKISVITTASPPQSPQSDTNIGFHFNQSLHDSSANPSTKTSPMTTSTEILIKYNTDKNNVPDIQLPEMSNETIHSDFQTMKIHPQEKTLETSDCHTFPKKRKDLIRNSRVERVKSKHLKLSTTSLQFQAVDNLAVSIKRAVFSWDNCNTLLRIDCLEIPKGRLTVVVGKNDSGKSSLLGALLMEMQQISGEIVWNKFSTIAYVPQVPWLLNANIRENILFGESFRPKRYEMVLKSCALKPDIDLMPDGDMTMIGECGINLSGGQKQRVAIARALYSSANVVIMDDPLSSLDNEVAKHVFERSVQKILLKANRTVILVTQQIQLVHNADYIVVMKEGCMQAAGSYKYMEENYPKIVGKWKSIIKSADENEKLSPGRTARERWKLFKNISRIGLQRPNSIVENEPVSKTLASNVYNQPKKRPSVYGSRHLMYEMPIPIDEYQDEDVIIRHRTAGTAGANTYRRVAHSLELNSCIPIHKQEILRVHSLQPDLHSVAFERTAIMRNISSPGFQQFLHRMSSRKSNKPTPTPKMHRPVSATDSIISISEESHVSIDGVTDVSSSACDEEGLSLQEVNTENLPELLIESDTKLPELNDERTYGEIPVHVYVLYLKSAGLPIAFVFFISALIWQCLRVYTDIWLQRWTEKATSTIHDMTYYFQIYAIISSICILMALITTPAGQIAGCNVRKFLHDKLLQSILSKSLHFFQITPLGRIMNRFSNDMAVIDKKIAATSQRLLQFTLLCLCAILINVSITPWFVILTLPICGAYYIIQKFYRCSSRELQRLESMTNSPVISHFAETIEGVVTIRAYSQEARFTETLFKRLESNTIAFTILNTSNRWLGISLDYLGAVIVFVAILTALVAASISSGNAATSVNNSINNSSAVLRVIEPSPSLVGLAINYTLLVPIYLNWVVKLLADMEMYVSSIERVSYYAEKESDEIGGIAEGNIDINNTSASRTDKDKIIYKSVPISWPQKGDITFENVSLKHEGQNENVISGLSLKIPAGQKVGICGRTGSGKSSLALSLFGVLNTTCGKILIDDVDLSQIHPEEIRSRLSIIPQDVHLFQASIRENLDPRRHYSDFDLWKCLELAQLKEFIVNTMPHGLETEISDGGRNLSVGHRQLFCLARAILRGSVCLVLDEATSSLDTTTEKALLNAAHNAFQGRTILTIAHRLSTILDYDRIIVLENGQIVQDGSPRELQSDNNGKFYNLLKSGRLGPNIDETSESYCKSMNEERE